MHSRALHSPCNGLLSHLQRFPAQRIPTFLLIFLDIIFILATLAGIVMMHIRISYLFTFLFLTLLTIPHGLVLFLFFSTRRYHYLLFCTTTLFFLCVCVCVEIRQRPPWRFGGPPLSGRGRNNVIFFCRIISQVWT
jgi:hypothetical protein